MNNHNKTITNLLQNPLTQDILKVRKEKDEIARKDMINEIGLQQVRPDLNNNPTNWIAVSTMSDISIYRLAHHIYTEGVKGLTKQLQEVYMNIHINYIEQLLKMGEKVSSALYASMGNYIDEAFPKKSSSDIVDELLLGTQSANAITSTLINRWVKQSTSYKRNKRRCGRIVNPLWLNDNDIPVFNRDFLANVEYAISNLSSSVCRFSDSSGRFHSDNLYRASSEASELQTQLQDTVNKGIKGIFRELYASTKGYYNPLCRACLYSPKTKIFWYALRPITLKHTNNDDEDVKHTFNNIWIAWDYNRFIKSVGTYCDSALTIYRTGDLHDESASNGHIHPHVGVEGNLCLGSAGLDYNLASNAFNLGAGLDVVIGVLNNYVSSDAYAPLLRFTMTRDMWRREHGDGDDEDIRYCDECGDDVDMDSDVCSNGNWFHAEGCCEYSERDGEYIAVSDAIWCDSEDTFIRSDDAITLHSDSEVGGVHHVEDEEICQLWVPERIEDTRIQEEQDTRASGHPLIRATLRNISVFSTAPNEQAQALFVGNIAWVHSDDVCQEEENSNAESNYVKLSSTVYGKVCNPSPGSKYTSDAYGALGNCMMYHPVAPHNVWGRKKDCAWITLDDSPTVKHYVLKLHLEESELIQEAVIALGLDIITTGVPNPLTNNTKENEETIC